jgi:phosphogluconate dehydratase
VLNVEVDEATFAARTVQHPDLSGNTTGTGRDLFGLFRQHASTAESGASPLFT